MDFFCVVRVRLVSLSSQSLTWSHRTIPNLWPVFVILIQHVAWPGKVMPEAAILCFCFLFMPTGMLIQTVKLHVTNATRTMVL